MRSENSRWDDVYASVSSHVKDGAVPAHVLFTLEVDGQTLSRRYSYSAEWERRCLVNFQKDVFKEMIDDMDTQVIRALSGYIL